jgi:hypothetical protein
VDNLAPQATTLAELRRARARWDSLQRLRRPLAVVVAALVIVTVLRGHPAPGVQGRPLGVLIGLIALLGGGGAALASRRLSRAAQVGAFTVFFAGAATLLLVQPGGLGVLGLLVALGTAAARVSGRAGGVLVVAVLVLVVTARVVTDGGQLDVTVVNVIAVVTLYSVAVGARRLRDSNEQAELLLVDLAASRESQLRAAALAERQRLAWWCGWRAPGCWRPPPPATRSSSRRTSGAGSWLRPGSTRLATRWGCCAARTRPDRTTWPRWPSISSVTPGSPAGS